MRLLEEKIRRKKSDIRVLKNEFNSSHSLLQHEINFINFAFVSSPFVRSNNRILASKSATQQKKLSRLVKSNISVQVPYKVIFNFSKYEISDSEKKLLAKGLNFSLPPKCLDYVDYLVNFDLLYRNRGGSRTAATSKMERLVIIVNGWKPLTIITKRSILDVAAALDPPLRNIRILSSEDLDFVKTRKKAAALSSYRNYNNNVSQHLSNEEFLALQNLLKKNHYPKT